MSSFSAPASSASPPRCIFRRAGATVALVDRLGEAADETTFGNAGLVQSEAVFPYMFPARPGRDRQRRRSTAIRARHIRYAALPAIARALWQYYQFSHPRRRVAETAAAMSRSCSGAA